MLIEIMKLLHFVVCSTAIPMAIAAGCSAGGETGDAGTTTGGSSNGAGGTGGAVVGTGGTGAIPLPTGGSGPGLSDASAPKPDAGCQQFAIDWEPKIPTVFMLVDRSGSMFQNFPMTQTNAWETLRTGALEVLADIQAEVRVGFGAYAAFNGMCPDLPTVAPEFNNYDAIANLYNSLEQPNSGKIDTGSSFALDQAAEVLWADTVEGDKYILFVTDGEPDYCDDPNPICPVDSVVWTLQRLRAGLDRTGGTHAPIHTIVFGVGSELTMVSEAALVSFANAGAGEPVPYFDTSPNLTGAQCTGVQGWMDDFTAAGKATDAEENHLQTLAEYSSPGGTVMPFKPDPADQSALTEAIRSALAGVKSCSFDITEGNIEIDHTREDLGEVSTISINGAAIPFDPANGWHMPSATEVRLEGQACETWRQPVKSVIDFNFPCDVVIIVE